jgi:hypothetical protein
VWRIVAKVAQEEQSLSSTSWLYNSLHFTYQQPHSALRKVSIPRIKMTVRTLTNALSPALDCLFPDRFEKVPDKRLLQLEDLDNDNCFWEKPLLSALLWLREKQALFLKAALNPSSNLKLMRKSKQPNQARAKLFLNKCQMFLKVFSAQFLLTVPIPP